MVRMARSADPASGANQIAGLRPRAPHLGCYRATRSKSWLKRFLPPGNSREFHGMKPSPRPSRWRPICRAPGSGGLPRPPCRRKMCCAGAVHLPLVHVLRIGDQLDVARQRRRLACAPISRPCIPGLCDRGVSPGARLDCSNFKSRFAGQSFGVRPCIIANATRYAAPALRNIGRE